MSGPVRTWLGGEVLTVRFFNHLLQPSPRGIDSPSEAHHGTGLGNLSPFDCADIVNMTKGTIMATVPNNPQSPAQGQGATPSNSPSDGPRSETGALASLGAELLRRAIESQPGLEAAWDDLMTSWGVQGEAVGVQRLRAMIQEDSGASPEDNAFTRELISRRADPRS